MDTPAPEYEWGKDRDPRPSWRLRPVGSPDWHVLQSIATVSCRTWQHPRRHVEVSAHYYWPFSTGNAKSGTAKFKSVPQARKWCEAQLAKFWEPPAIKKG